MTIFGLLLASIISIAEAGARQEFTSANAVGMSGITWIGGNDFVVVTDGALGDCKAHVICAEFDQTNKMISLPKIDNGVVLEGANDVEGVAYDPFSGCIWVSDESDTSIREYNFETGKRTGREVPIPEFVRESVRPNLSLEGLSISGDGLTLWTANEEALSVDGSRATTRIGTLVRLMKFKRKNVSDEWEGAGMWAYRCSRIHSFKPVCSGISALCALPDGSLLVMERECSYETRGRIRIYRPDFTKATDVSNIQSLQSSPYVAVTRGSLLYEVFDGEDDGLLDSKIACYEGLCLGPNFEDGSLNLMVISDGGATATQGMRLFSVTVRAAAYVRALTLKGLDVCTLAFTRPAEGDASITGSGYRFLKGTDISLSLFNSDETFWHLPKHEIEGFGTNATFKVEKDDRFYWRAK